MISKEVREYIDRSVLCWLATCDNKGVPNVSPKEVFCASENETLLIAHIASPKSVKNITINPQVCISFIDIFEQKGYKINGEAKVYFDSDDGFAHKSKGLLDIAGPDFPVRAVIEVEISHIHTIVAPRYILYPETKVEDQVSSALTTYNVQRKN